MVAIKCFKYFCCSLIEWPTGQSSIRCGSLGSSGLSVDVLSQNHNNKCTVSLQHCLLSHLFSRQTPWFPIMNLLMFLPGLSCPAQYEVIFGFVRKSWQYLCFRHMSVTMDTLFIVLSLLTVLWKGGVYLTLYLFYVNSTFI